MDLVGLVLLHQVILFLLLVLAGIFALVALKKDDPESSGEPCEGTVKKGGVNERPSRPPPPSPRGLGSNENPGTCPTCGMPVSECRKMLDRLFKTPPPGPCEVCSRETNHLVIFTGGRRLYFCQDHVDWSERVKETGQSFRDYLARNHACETCGSPAEVLDFCLVDPRSSKTYCKKHLPMHGRGQ